LTDDVIQVMSQLGPIMKQLSGVDMEKMLQDLARLPGAVADKVGGGSKPQAGKKTGQVFGGE
ncbi:MAG: hypothetical protein KAJ78_10020, partial [Acidobacteria bacterium]|nr:hypothetical protein [Acidobacteriota bacterium]